MSFPEQRRGGEQSGPGQAVAAVHGPVPGYDVAVDAQNLRGYDPLALQTGIAVLSLLLDARETLPRARSYRDFWVAVTAWATGPDTIGRRVGYNVKLSPDDTNDTHAEELMEEKTRQAGFTCIPTLVLMGEPQTDQTSGQSADTLLPCERRCTPRLLASPLIDNESTLVVMARPDFRVIQFASMLAIQAFHETGDDSGITTVRFPETPAILRVGRWDGPQNDGALVPVEIDSTDYDMGVTIPLAVRALGLTPWPSPGQA